MSTRIRYSRQSDSLLQSVRKFQHPSNGQRYKVLLRPLENEWIVIDDTTDLIAASGHTKSLHKMKQEAKEALVTLGVAFEIDKRDSSEASNQVSEVA